MRHIHMTPTILSQIVLLLSVIVLGARLAGAIPETYTLHFSDVPPTATLISSPERAASQAPANAWLDPAGLATSVAPSPVRYPAAPLPRWPTSTALSPGLCGQNVLHSGAPA